MTSLCHGTLASASASALALALESVALLTSLQDGRFSHGVFLQHGTGLPKKPPVKIDIFRESRLGRLLQLFPSNLIPEAPSEP